MFEELVSKLAKRGAIIELTALNNGTRGVRYSAVVKTKDEWGSTPDFPTFEFKVGGWSLDEITTKIEAQLSLVEHLLAIAEEEIIRRRRPWHTDSEAGDQPIEVS
jgi:hypothetical protein